eukprot:1410505-Pyramimonas_sp.AAC.5
MAWDAGRSEGIFSRRANQTTQDAQVYSHDGPIRHSLQPIVDRPCKQYTLDVVRQSVSLPPPLLGVVGLSCYTS